MQQNGFGIDRDEILIESVPKTDRLVPCEGQGHFLQRTRSADPYRDDMDTEMNFYPL